MVRLVSSASDCRRNLDFGLPYLQHHTYIPPMNLSREPLSVTVLLRKTVFAGRYCSPARTAAAALWSILLQARNGSKKEQITVFRSNGQEHYLSWISWHRRSKILQHADLWIMSTSQALLEVLVPRSQLRGYDVFKPRRESSFVTGDMIQVFLNCQ